MDWPYSRQILGVFFSLNLSYVFFWDTLNLGINYSTTQKTTISV